MADFNFLLTTVSDAISVASKEHTHLTSLLPKLTCKIPLSKVKLIYLPNNTLETNFKIFFRGYTLESSTMIFSDTNIYTVAYTYKYIHVYSV